MSFQEYFQDINITSAWRSSFSRAKSLASSDMAEEIFSVDTRANFFSVAASFCLSSASRRSRQSILFRNWFWKKKNPNFNDFHNGFDIKIILYNLLQDFWPIIQYWPEIFSIYMATSIWLQSRIFDFAP